MSACQTLQSHDGLFYLRTLLTQLREHLDHVHLLEAYRKRKYRSLGGDGYFATSAFRLRLPESKVFRTGVLGDYGSATESSGSGDRR